MIQFAQQCDNGRQFENGVSAEVFLNGVKRFKYPGTGGGWHVFAWTQKKHREQVCGGHDRQQKTAPKHHKDNGCCVSFFQYLPAGLAVIAGDSVVSGYIRTRASALILIQILVEWGYLHYIGFKGLVNRISRVLMGIVNYYAIAYCTY
jgi:hypothetical protein